ncbi:MULTISPECIES: lipoyl(octanoyl) transferase LipB [Nocardiaceae]|uniref:lipoyl(octanoyl) transferase LipB n=1 Tax=Nocardiaceae TaxID=85025 RepID=UPI00037CA52C|nr:MULTISPECIES: lipoyl(octanoyl) transferase LipB [Rhodococcus]OZC61384.1 lipoate--protein ligase B [Rhodococcus sp. 06-621-2]OZD13169.1 lipoate--protein ligase B [Rhodococcus sp. 06-156-4C]OZD16235.1 lipoate--protein ligase B [Rhodococcus sp. 06-156-3C]OZD17589.1 lipoate--protein ligase B [Rhodococcus sp. 06-156-4a]OZD34638.1 lipoate--protein ligase B [Rhodococcus sp. 06-156-3b]
MTEGVVSARESSDSIEVSRLGTVDYLDAWDRQRALADMRAEGVGRDTLLLLEHPSVYTAGRRTSPEDRPKDGTPVIEVDRGGKITWHGPGQLVGYPIVKLAQPIDVVRYVRRVEEALIAVCTDLGIDCGRIDGRSGVWLASEVRDGILLPERKIAAIGVRVQRGVTLHGFSLNCNSSTSGFDAIVPCGIADAGVTSLTSELGREVTVDDVIAAVVDAVTAALDGSLLVSEHPVARPDVVQVSTNPQFTTVKFGA